MKRCVRCGIEKPFVSFNKQSAAPDGLQRYCRECQKSTHNQYYWNNPEAQRERVSVYRKGNPEKVRLSNNRYYQDHKDEYKQRAREYRRKHPERGRQRSLAYYKHHKERCIERAKQRAQTHPEKVRQYKRKWQINNPLKRREIKHRRRARQHATRIGRISYASIWKREEGICYLCGLPVAIEDVHFEHVVPLAKGGSHTEDNIRLAHPLCNLRKGTRIIDP